MVGTLALYVAFPGSTVLTNSFGDRARALFKDPNVYGPFLVPVAVLVLHEVLEPRLLRIGRTLKLVWWASWCSGSRSPTRAPRG